MHHLQHAPRMRNSPMDYHPQFHQPHRHRQLHIAKLRLGVLATVLALLALCQQLGCAHAAHYADNGRKCMHNCGAIGHNWCFTSIFRIDRCHHANCVVGQWGAWGRCNLPCSGGERRRTRAVLVHPRNAGAGCPALAQTSACNTGSCNNLKLPSYGDPIPSSLVIYGSPGAHVKTWSNHWYKRHMDVHFECASLHVPFGSNPRKWDKWINQEWRTSGLQCTFCDKGKLVTGPNQCTKCNAGFDQPHYSRTTGCTPCRKGKYAPNKGTKNCFKCNPGSFAARTQMTKCDLCIPGRFAKNSGQQACADCPVGKYAPNDGHTFCLKCPFGYYQDEEGKDKCKPCTCDLGCKDCHIVHGSCKLKPGYCNIAYDRDDGLGPRATCFKELQRYPPGPLAGVDAISQPCLACQSNINTGVPTARRTTFRPRIEIAEGKPTAVSSTAWGHHSDLVDGNDQVLWTVTPAQATSNRPEQFNFFPSSCWASESSPFSTHWFRVDLGVDQPIEMVEIYTPGAAHRSSYDGLSSATLVQASPFLHSGSSITGNSLFTCSKGGTSSAPAGSIVQFDCRAAGNVRYIWVKRTVTFFGGPLALCEVRVFKRDVAPDVPRSGVWLDDNAYLQLEKSWNFWPGTVMMWFTAPADASTAGPSFVLLGTKTFSFFGGNSHGYNIELEADGDLVITWDRSHRFTVTQPRDIIFTGGMTHIAVVHTPSGAGRGITVYITTVRQPTIVKHFPATLPQATPTARPLFGRDYQPRPPPQFGLHVEHVEIHAATVPAADIEAAAALPPGKCLLNYNLKGCYGTRTPFQPFWNFLDRVDFDTSPYRNHMRFKGKAVKAPVGLCEDEKMCTLNDHCVSDDLGNNARCIGRPYKTCLRKEFTDADHRDCHHCDGKGGCIDKAGHFSGPDEHGNIVCGCKIGGVFYPHKARNPANDCQECNVLAPHSNTDWRDLFDDFCVNDNPCTLDNRCRADPVRRVSCQATSTYTCVKDLCSSKATCHHDDGCKQTPRRRNLWGPFTSPQHRCSTSPDPCIADSWCEVGISACPAPIVTQPVIQQGTFTVNLPNPPHRFIGHRTGLGVRISGWKAACGDLHFKWGVHQVDPQAVTCDPVGVASFSPSRVLGVSRRTIMEPVGFLQFRPRVVTEPITLSTARVDLDMAHGSTYVALIQFQNQNPGDAPVTVCSLPFTVDTSPPEVVGAIKHLDPLAPTPTEVTSHHAHWFAASWTGAFIDPDSNSATALEYSWHIHTTPQPYIRGALPRGVGVTVIDTQGSYRAFHNREYYVTVGARNNAGLTTWLTTPTPVAIDHSPPFGAGVRDGVVVGQDVAFVKHSSNVSLGVNWDQFGEDRGSVTYEVALAYTPGQDTIASFRFAPPGPSARSYLFVGPLPVLHAERVFAVVRAWNEAGLFTIISSSGVVLDGTAPTVTTVEFLHASSSDYGAVGTTGALYQSHAAAFATRVVCDDDVAGQTMTYSVVWGTSSGASDVGGPFQGSAPAGSAVVALSGAALVVAADTSQVWVSGSCTNSAGHTTVLPPTAITIDASAPDTTAAVVQHINRALPGAPQVQFTSATILEASWAGFADPLSGLVVPCSWAVNSDASSAPMSSAFRQAVNVQTATTNAAVLQLQHGVKYYFWVRCFNGAGASSTVRSSGITVHKIAPTRGLVHDGAGGWWNSSKPFVSIVPSSVDASVAATVGNTAAALQDGDGTTGVATNAAAGSPHTVELVLAQATFIDALTAAYLLPDSSGGSVEVQVLTHPAGWQSMGSVETTSPGTVTPLRFPRPVFTGRVRLRAAARIRVSEVALHHVDVDGIDGSSGSPTTVSASWSNVQEPSGVRGVEWSLASCPGESVSHVLFPLTTDGVSMAQRAATRPFASAFIPLVRYCTTVRVTSNVGLSASFVSDGFALYQSAPTVVVLFDGPQGIDANVQRSNSSLSATWLFKDNNLVPGDSLVYAWGAGSSPSGVDVVPLVSVEGATATTADGLSLQNGAWYYSTVRAVNPAGLWTLASSNGVRIDITAPSLTEVDGSLLQDVDVQTNVNLTVVDARWPVAGGVFEFYWKVGRIRHGDDVQPLTAVGTFVHVVLEVDPPLIVGAVYYVDVYSRSAAGLILYAHGSMLADDTPPLIVGLAEGQSVVTNGNGTLLATYDTETDEFNLQWAAAQEVGVVTYQWLIGLQPGVASVFGPVSAGTALNDSATLVLQPSPDPYYVTLVATNEGGVSSEVSVTLFVDGQGPQFGWVIDGFTTGVDQQYQSELDRLGCSWGSFEDPISGVAAYYVGFGTVPGLVDVMSYQFVNVTAELSFNLTGLQLPPGIKFYCVVKAVDGAGFASVRNSNGVTAEVTPPVPGTVYDGVHFLQDIQFQQTLQGVAASWVGFVEAESKIQSFHWGVGTSPGADDVLAFRSVGLSTAAHDASVTLQEGIVYYSSVRCYNVRGMVSVASSDGFQVDFSSPTGIDIAASAAYLAAEGTADRLTCTCPAEHATFDTNAGSCVCDEDRIPALVDADNTIGVEAVCECPSGGCSFGLPQQPLRRRLVVASPACAQLSERTGPHTLQGQDCVCAAGHYLDYTLKECVLCPEDTYKPAPGDSPTDCVPCWAGAAEVAILRANYQVSGAASAEVFAGTGPRIAPFSSAVGPASTSHVFSDLPLGQGTTWYATLVATAAGGGVASSQSSTLAIDYTPPRLGRVVDVLDTEGDLGDVDYQTDDSKLSVAWFGWQDALGDLNLERVSVAWGTAPHDTSASGGVWVPVPLADAQQGSFEFTPPGQLTPGQRYYATVRIANTRGHSSARASDGVVVDTTAPAFVGAITMLPEECSGNTAATHQASVTALHATWQGAFEDAESGVAWYEYRLMAQDGGPPAGAPIEVQPLTRTSLVSVNDTLPFLWDLGDGLVPRPEDGLLVLRPGWRYYVEVRAANRAGLVSAIHSGSFITVSPAAPVTTARFVASAAAATSNVSISVTKDATTLFLAYTVDAGEGVVTEIQVYIGTSPGSLQVLLQTVAVSQGLDGTAAGIVVLDGLSLVTGTVYYGTVRATNAAGVASADTTASAEVLVDATQPVGGTVVVHQLPRPAAADEDAQPGFSAHPNRLEATVGGFADPESGIVSVEVGVDSGFANPSVPDTSIVPYRVVVLNSVGEARVVLEFADRPDGDTIRVFARATNGAGESKVVQSSWVVIDTSPPTYAIGFDVRVSNGPLEPLTPENAPPSLPYIVYLATTSPLHVSWDERFVELHNSRFHRHRWSVRAAVPGVEFGSYNAGEVLAGPFDADEEVMDGVVEGLNIGHGGRFLVEVSVWNNAGFKTTAHSPVVVIDTAPPVAGLVVADGPAHLQHGVALDAGPGHNYAASACRCAVPFARFDLRTGKCVCVAGRFFDAASGTCEECAVFDGSTTGGVCGAQPHVFSWPTSGALGACAACPQDMYRVLGAAGSEPSSCPECQPCTPPGPRFRGLLVVSDDEQLVDVALTGFISELAPVEYYTLAFGTSPLGTQLSLPDLYPPPATPGHGLLAGVSFIPQHGDTVYVTVAAISAAGNKVTATVPVLTFDATPPAAGAVSLVLSNATGPASTLQHVSFQPSASTIRIRASDFSDVTSGVAVTEFGAFSTPCDFANAVGPSTLPNFAYVLLHEPPAAPESTVGADGTRYVELVLPAGEHLSHRQSVYGCAAATNGAGLTAYASSAVTVVDLKPPVPGAVLDGDRADVDADCSVWADEVALQQEAANGGSDNATSDAVEDAAGASSFTVTWARFYDGTSGVAVVEVGLGTAPLEADLMAFTAIDVTLTSYTHPNASSVAAALPGSSSQETTLYWSVRVTDAVGAQTTVSSNGVRVACLGLGGDAGAACRTQLASSAAAASGTTWSSCVSFESSLVQYRGPSDGDVEVVDTLASVAESSVFDAIYWGLQG